MCENKIILAMLLVGAGLLVGCSAQSQTRVPESRPINSASPVVVHVFDVQPSHQPEAADLLIPAALSVQDTAIVLAERDGRIVDLQGQEGARVAKGESIARFNDEDQRTRLREAELEVSRLKVEGQQFEAMIKLNRSEFDRESLLASQGLVSKGDVERARYKLEQSIHECEKTRLATDSTVARLDAVKLELQKSTVRAPIPGVITRRYIALGTNVARNDKLFEVSQLSKIELRFRVPQNAGRALGPGKILELSTLDPNTIIAKARIRSIDPIADPTSNTFGYIADILNGTDLMPGLTVYVHLSRAAEGASFWLPRAAFSVSADLRTGASSTLFVIDREKAVSRSVIVRSVEGDQVEVVGGLVKEDQVVLAPPTGLKDGDLVEVRQG